MGKYHENLSIGELKKEQFLVIAFETIQLLGWRIKFISDAGVIAYTNNGAFSWNGEITVKLLADVATVQSISIGMIIQDFGRNKAVVNKFIGKFAQLQNSLTDEELKKLYSLYQADFLPAHEDTLKPYSAPPQFSFSDYLSSFKFTRVFWVTPFLVILNVLAFVMMICSGVPIFRPDSEPMIQWGANVSTLTLGDEWWRLWTNNFVHFGLMHLLLNMFALGIAGKLLEPLLGKTKFIIAYILSGLIASIVSLWWHDYAVSAGASGSIVGLYGLFLVIWSAKYFKKNEGEGLMIGIVIFIAYNLFCGFNAGIDNAANAGGLLGGMLIGFLYLPQLKQKDNVIFSRLSMTTLILLVFSFLFWSYSTMAGEDRFIYRKGIKEFYETEKLAMEFYRQPENTVEPAVLYSLKEHGIQYWQRNIKLLQQMNELQLPDQFHQRIEALDYYCRLQLRYYELEYLAKIESTDQYNLQIAAVTNHLNVLYRELAARR